MVSRVARPRRYLPRPVFLALRPLLRYSLGRDAYVLHVIGNSVGPVVREERRRGRGRSYAGAERRGRTLAT